MVMNRLHFFVCDVGNVCKGCANLSRSCCVCTMFKLQMACGYCALVKYHRSDGERGPFLQNARVFPVYSSLLSNPPLPRSCLCLRLFFSLSGMWWRSVNVTSTKASFKMDFSFSLFLKEGRFMSWRLQLRHFFPSLFEFSTQLPSGKYWELRVRLRLWTLSHFAPAWQRLGLIQVQSGGWSGMAHAQRCCTKMESH